MRITQPIRVLALACAGLVLAGGDRAAATVSIHGNDGDDAVVLYQVLTQTHRPLFASARGSGGAFGPLRAVKPAYEFDQQDAVVDDAGGAVAIWRRERPSEVVAAVKPPDGAFSRPRRLSTGVAADLVALAGNGRGDVIAVWSRGRGSLRYSFRPAGGAFGPPASLPGDARLGSLRAFVDEDGGALVFVQAPAAGADRTHIDALYRPPGGTFGPAREVPGAPGHALGEASAASNRRGDLLIAWNEGGILKAVERVRGGDFGEPFTVTSGLGPDEAVTAVALGSGGDGLIAYGDTPLELVVRDGAGAWSAPRPMPGFRGVGLRAQVDPLGNAVLSWADTSRELKAVYRTAGTDFGAPLSLAPARPSAPGPMVGPSLSIDGSGEATIAWEESDGEHVSAYARSFGAAGAEPRVRLGRFRTYVQEAPRSACRPRWGKVVKRSRRAALIESRRVYESGVLFACLFGRGAIFASDEFEGGPFPQIGLAGPFLAAAGDSCDPEYCDTTVEVTDLRDETDGANRSANAWPGGGTAEVPALKLKPNGAVAWIACYAPLGPERGTVTFRCTVRGRARKRVFVWDRVAGKPRQVDVGRRIDPESLLLRGSRLTWVNRGERHAARLR
jgi:hypothetical protein